MVNFKKLTDKAKDVVDKRGGVDSLKEDAQELRERRQGQGQPQGQGEGGRGGGQGARRAGGSAAKPSPRRAQALEGDEGLLQPPSGRSVSLVGGVRRGA